MKPQTPQEASVPTGFDGAVNVSRGNGNIIYDAIIVEWTDHGIVIVYDTGCNTRLRRFIPYNALSSISALVIQQEEA